MKLKKLIIILLVILQVLFISGCSHNQKASIVTINDTKLYKSDFLYEIYLVESEGNQLETYYQNNLGYSYWDYQYSGTTIRELAKSSVLASVVMHEILYREATEHGLKLTKEEISANDTTVGDLIKASSQEQLDSVGLTRPVISNSLNKITLAEKYKDVLSSDFNIDEASIRESINRDDYSSDAQYEQAVKDAVASKKDQLFVPVYKKIKSKYDISINFKNWDKIIIGSVTVPK